MKLLAIDTATLVASAAVWTDGVVVEGETQASTHSEKLLPLVDEVLGRAGLVAADVDAVACGAGPGSFTGLRIGLATAKGLCLALDKPLLLVSSLAALALGAAGEETVLAVLDARKQEVYAGLFRLSPLPVALAPEVVLPPERVVDYAARHDAAVVGDGALAYPAHAAAWGRLLPGVRATPSAAAVARLAAARLARGEADSLPLAEPTYIRHDVATPPKAR